MSQPDHSSVIRISRFGWCVVGAVLLLPWTIVWWSLQSAAPAHPAVVSSAPSPKLSANSSAKSAIETAPPGPWGQLEYTRVLIEPPEDFVPPFYTTPQPLRWVFKNYTTAALDTLWQQAGLTPAQSTALNDPSRRTTNGSDLVLAPPAETVLGLAPAARATIYAVLATFPENVPQRDPFRARVDAIEDWFEGDLLPAEIVALTRQLLYPRNGSLLFADHDLVLPKLATPAARVGYIKTRSRKSALLVQLQLAHGTDPSPIARYWGQGRRSKDVGPLLESLAQRPQGGAIDIVHLLPPFARRLLYTYPVPSDLPTDASRDCHWTSLNFYNDQPDDRFTQIDYVQEILLKDYYQLGGAPALGDVVMLVRPDGQGVHSCVYIAGDIVFTKNGAAFSVPWLLSRLENVVAFYSLTSPLQVRYYRAKSR